MIPGKDQLIFIFCLIIKEHLGSLSPLGLLYFWVGDLTFFFFIIEVELTYVILVSGVGGGFLTMRNLLMYNEPQDLNLTILDMIFNNPAFHKFLISFFELN